MTLASILQRAASIAKAYKSTNNSDTEVCRFAEAVIDLLSDDGEECGMPMPTVVTLPTVGMRVFIPADACGPWTSADVRGFARSVFVAADEAEAAASLRAKEGK